MNFPHCRIQTGRHTSKCIFFVSFFSEHTDPMNSHPSSHRYFVRLIKRPRVSYVFMSSWLSAAKKNIMTCGWQALMALRRRGGGERRQRTCQNKPVHTHRCHILHTVRQPQASLAVASSGECCTFLVARSLWPTNVFFPSTAPTETLPVLACEWHSGIFDSASRSLWFVHIVCVCVCVRVYVCVCVWTYCFFLHSMARSMMKSVRLINPSALSAWRKHTHKRRADKIVFWPFVGSLRP